jgi:hypothetical protein
MSRIFISESTGAAVYLFADDHCPPHVHARHRNEGWIARVQFSFVNNDVGLLSIAPPKHAPLQRVVNELLDDVGDRVTKCRRQWWTTRQTTCLINQWAKVSVAGKIELLAERKASAKQIADSHYDPASDRTRVSFHDGTATDVRLQA